MCDPISLLAAAGSVASAGIGYMGEQATLKAQQGANADWVAYQRQKAREADARDETMRQKAEAARQDTLGKVGSEAAGAAQDKAEGVLNDQMLQGNVAGDANIKMLAGQDANADAGVSDELQKRETGATREARGRIKALAGLNSFGNSFDSAMQTGETAINEGNQAIDMQGNLRNGNTRVLGTAQAVPVETFVQGSNMAGGISSALAGLAGSAFQRSSANPIR
jgi:hypothetical protein